MSTTQKVKPFKFIPFPLTWHLNRALFEFDPRYVPATGCVVKGHQTVFFCRPSETLISVGPNKSTSPNPFWLKRAHKNNRGSHQWPTFGLYRLSPKIQNAKGDPPRSLDVCGLVVEYLGPASHSPRPGHSLSNALPVFRSAKRLAFG